MQANLPAWVRYPDFERVQWMNDLLDQLWPNMKAAAAGIVRSTTAFPNSSLIPAQIESSGLKIVVVVAV